MIYSNMVSNKLYSLCVSIYRIKPPTKKSKKFPFYQLILMNFDKILTKFDQILIIYVKKHKIHVICFQERHFLGKKKPLRECQHIAQGLG